MPIISLSMLCSRSIRAIFCFLYRYIHTQTKYQQEHFEAMKLEFKTEVELLAKIDHRNLVKLLGYVDKGNDCLIITEFVPNGTLRDHLDGKVSNLRDSSTLQSQF